MSTYPIDPITLRINGVDWAFWQSVSITRSMDAIAGAFNVSLADKWADGKEVMPIAAGAECEVLIGSEPVITGYVDKVSNSFSATAHSISINGRDKSADLVDCSAIHEPGQWKEQTVEDLANIFAGPFGVGVTVEGDIGAPIPTFKLEEGETAFEALDRALKLREVLATPDGKGNIILLKVGARNSSLELKQGENILSGTSDFDMTDRFSDYIVKGQKPGNDKEYGLKAAQIKSEVKDEGVKRYRPLLVRAESNVDSGSAQKRADWERTVRAARSVTVSVTVQGFRQAPSGTTDGDLWQVNALTQVDIPYLRISGELLIKTVTFNRDGSAGSTTTLELVDPNSFTPEPEKLTEQQSGQSASSKKTPKTGTSSKNLQVEAQKDLQTRMAEDAAKRQNQIKEG